MDVKTLIKFKGDLSRTLALFAGMLLLVGCATQLQVQHPYEGVNWSSYGQYKANLHTHTTLSDGKKDPAGVIDMYHDRGYAILSLTDHDTKGPETTTWPWQDFGRDADILGMVAIEGNEISKHHHINSFFCSYGDADVESEEVAIQQITHHHGEAVFNHPGRYTRRKGDNQKTVEWYVDLFQRHEHLLGLEIYNQTDRFPGDRETWDAILTQALPERLVWGFANDDMHVPEKHFAYSWNVMLLPKLDSDQVQAAMQNGRFFFAHSPKGDAGPSVPVIKKIIVNERAGTVHIKASGYESIEWIAEGEVVHKGDEIDLSLVPESKYVRAMAYGPEGTVIGTQPFVLVRP
jgi:hypothetical protein